MFQVLTRIMPLIVCIGHLVRTYWLSYHKHIYLLDIAYSHSSGLVLAAYIRTRGGISGNVT